MAVFHDLVALVNRAPEPLSVCFDGQESTLQPGVNMVPAICVLYAKNQNPILGTADVNNPNVSGCKYLVGVQGTKDNVTPLTAKEWKAHCEAPSRWNMKEYYQDRLGKNEHMVVRGGRKPRASFSEAKVHTAIGTDRQD